MRPSRAAFLFVVVTACSVRSSSSESAPAGSVPAAGTGAVADQYHGLAIQVDTSDRPVAMFGPLIREVAALGADTVLIGADAYQKNASSGTVSLDPKKTPTEAQWKRLLTIARKECGLQVILAPKILLSHPIGTEWRGVIQPPSWPKWFVQYRRVINHFADVAQANGVEVLMVGSELVSAEKHTEEWLEVVRQARARYSGRLSYSANWDHYQPVKFWDRLDLIGMTSYYKLSDKAAPTVAQLVEAWAPIKDNILEWQKGVGKPILFTEVGWCSQEGASIEPWNYYHKQEATAKGRQEQRACYEAFIATWDLVPQVGGVIWWEWTTYGGGSDCYNYTPKGKPAEQVLRRWFAGKAARRRGARGGAADTTPPPPLELPRLPEDGKRHLRP